MSGDLQNATDPVTASLDALVAIVFTKSNSKSYLLAVEISKKSSNYSEIIVGNKLTHIAIFSSSKHDAVRSIALLELISDWKGVQIFSRGLKLDNSYYAQQVIRCFINASNCMNSAAYCQTVIDDPKTETKPISSTIVFSTKPKIKVEKKIEQFTFPCKYLHGYFRYQKNHPADIFEQIQAAAVERGCSWCPNFSEKNFKSVGSRTIYQDYFE
jgi:hypothetical protein